MKITFLTLFPNMYNEFLNTSIIKRAISKGAVEIEVVDIRAYTLDKNNRVDDCPIGGGAGLILKPQPVIDCIKAVKKNNSKVIYTSPKGITYNQNEAKRLSKEDHIIILCGHYEGIDERILSYCDEQISVGDYILTGGELPSQIIADSIIRLLDGAITSESLDIESFDNLLLEYPQFTFPRVYEGMKVPDILFCGDHKIVEKYRLKESLKLTKKLRPDLLENRKFSKLELELLKEIEEGNEEPKWYLDAIEKAKKFMK
mgnify:CR=1 FL=1